MSTRFYPTRGVHGSTYMTSDGVVYVRTPWGTRRLDAAVGHPIHSLQSAFVRITTRRRLIHTAFAIGGIIVGAIISALVF